MNAIRTLPPVLLAALMLAGCESLIPPRAHLLPLPELGDAEGALRRELILLAPLALPEYAAERRIAVLEQDGEVSQGAGDVWADSPVRAGTLALARALEARSGAAVLADPAPLEAAPSLRIEVIVDKFLGPDGGPVALEGAYRVSDLRANGLAIFSRFTVEGSSEEDGMAGLVAAHADALDRLAAAMTDKLTRRYGR